MAVAPRQADYFAYAHVAENNRGATQGTIWTATLVSFLVGWRLVFPHGMRTFYACYSGCLRLVFRATMTTVRGGEDGPAVNGLWRSTGVARNTLLDHDAVQQGHQ